MILRILLSEWVFVLLMLVMVVGVANSVHSDRPPTPFERRIAYGSIALPWAWVLAKGWSEWRVRRGRAGEDGSSLD